MKACPPCLNPAPFLVAAALAVLAAVPAVDASSHPPDEDAPTVKGLVPVLSVVAITAGLVVALALRGAGFGVSGPLVVLGLAAAAIVAYHTGALGGATA